jgi:hypothetical protein
MRWLTLVLLGAGLSITTVLIANFLGNLYAPIAVTGWFGMLITVLIGMPIAVGVAILNHRLFDIDRIINRTIVYATLTVALGLVYAGLVVGLQSVLRPLSGSSDLAIVMTTLVVAAVALPVRRRLQEVFDRRFNRRAYNAAHTIDAFSGRLRDQIDLDTLRYELLAVVHETMQPADATVWLRGSEHRA